VIARIIEACARNKFLVLVLTGVAVALGLLSLRSIALDAIPDLSDTQVIVYSRWDRSPDVI
jgi:Cu(I)/Ag(I) efflux system membrane protein CusA/SilA